MYFGFTLITLTLAIGLLSSILRRAEQLRRGDGSLTNRREEPRLDGFGASEVDPALPASGSKGLKKTHSSRIAIKRE